MRRRRWVRCCAVAALVTLPACSIEQHAAPARPGESSPSASPAGSPASSALSSPLSSPGADPPSTPTVTRLLVVGDIMLGRRVAVPDRPLRPLRFMAGRIRAADIAVGNLESTLSADGPPQQGGDSFAAPPGTLAGLEGVGFDAISLGNNHTGDFGVPAMLRSVELFERSQIAAFGAGRDRAAASRPAIIEHDGVEFGFVGFNAIGETPRATPDSPGALSVRMPPRTGPLNRADLDHVLGVVRRLDRRVDVVVVLPHWGTQYTHVAEPVQSRVGQALVRAGADLVVGGHPHWVQGLEPAGPRAVIAHSLGNFVFDMDFSPQAMEGVTLTATFRADRLVDVDLEAYRMGPEFAPRPLPGAAGEQVLADVREHSSGRFRSG